MPGIFGLLTSMPRPWAEEQLRRMASAMAREPFYAIGVWTDEALGVYLGWSARKGRVADEMPLRNESGDVTLVFSGEEFPEPDCAHRLRERGHSLNLDNASYLVHLYEETPSFPAGLNGWFHGLLIDGRRGVAMLFNDRYGMLRVYYHQAKEAFYFSAEAKAILAVRPELRSPDPRGLAEFVSCGCVLEDRTLFRGVRVLPCAAAWVFRKGALESDSRYFQPAEWEQQEPLEPEAYYRKLREVFRQILPRYFSGPEVVGMSLTGGLDTRMIMAWWTAQPESLPCYTFGGMFRDCHDVRVARQVARVCRQPHQVIPVGEEFLLHFPSYAERAVYLTDGCAEVNRAADLYANEQARQIAPVRLTGNYGGEVLRRVRAFKPFRPLPGLYAPELVRGLEEAERTYAEQLRIHPLSFAVFRQAPWHHYGLLALERSQLTLRSPYLDNELVRTVFRAPESAVASNAVCLRLIAEGNAELRRIRTDRGPSVCRMPFSAALQRGLLEFTFKAEYAYDYGMPQWLTRLDGWVSGLHLERLFLGRHKFAHFRLWYRHALADYVREMLLDSRALGRPYLQAKTVEAIVDSHTKGAANHTLAIHKLMTLELIHRLFLDSPPASGARELKGG